MKEILGETRAAKADTLATFHCTLYVKIHTLSIDF